MAHLINVPAILKDDYAGDNVLFSYADYYPGGFEMPGRQKGSSYRFGYQGQFAEKDTKTGFNHFEAREYDARIMRWTVTDPAGQYWSPYVGMGNNPINGTDPDGRFKREGVANFFNFMFNGNGVKQNKKTSEFYFEKGYVQNGEAYVSPIYHARFYSKGSLRVDWGIQGGVGIDIGAFSPTLFGELRTKPFGDTYFEWTPGAETKYERFHGNTYDCLDDNYLDPSLINTGWDATFAGAQYKLGKRGEFFDVGPKKSSYLYLPVVGKHSNDYYCNKVTTIRHSWGLGFKAAAIVGIKGNIDFGFKIGLN